MIPVDTIPVFVGYDARESVAWHVAVHSIITRTSEPVAFIPICNGILPTDIWWRGRGPYDSTDFSNARFAVPALMGYQGWAIFMDCDMLCAADIAELWAQRDPQYAVMVVKHHHQPTEKTKFLGAVQTTYRRKNWSSLMLLNCAHPACRELTPQYINRASGLDLHGFAWCPDEAIGELTGQWNVLATGPQTWEHPHLQSDRQPDLLHYTRGGPWHGHFDLGYRAWILELEALLAGANPRASAFSTLLTPDKFITRAIYRGEVSTDGRQEGQGRQG